jgi:uncharacterized protein
LEAALRLGVISDTHGQLRSTQDAVRMLESLEVERVLHCGDIGSAAIPELLAAWPVDYVLGNVDHDAGPNAMTLQRAIAAAGGALHGRWAALELAGLRIAILHGDNAPQLQTAIASDNGTSSATATRMWPAWSGGAERWC